MAELAEITKAFPKDTKICRLYQATDCTVTGWQRQNAVPICTVKTRSKCLGCIWNFRERERERENAHRWASEFMGYCKDMIIIVCLPASPPPLNILFKGAQQTPGDVLKMKQF